MEIPKEILALIPDGYKRIKRGRVKNGDMFFITAAAFRAAQMQITEPLGKFCKLGLDCIGTDVKNYGLVIRRTTQKDTDLANIYANFNQNKT